MVTVERIREQHLADWIDMMLLLWDDNSYEVLKTEQVEIINSENNGNFICYNGDVSVGFINMSLRYDYVPGSSKSPTGYIEGLYVKSDYRKQGVARRLIEAGEDWEEKKGVRNWVLTVSLIIS